MDQFAAEKTCCHLVKLLVGVFKHALVSQGPGPRPRIKSPAQAKAKPWSHTP